MRPQCLRSLKIVLSLLVLLAAASPVIAQPQKHLDPLSWDRNVSGLMRKYCYRCHNGERASGGIDLQQDVNPRLILEHRPTWDNARSMLEFDAMPPAKAPQPTKEERKIMVDFLVQTLDNYDCESVKNPGPPPFRRLNKVEYNNTIRELTGLDIRPADNFSPDPGSYGFDNIGAALTLSPVLIEQYHKAAREIAAAILQTGAPSSADLHPLLVVDAKLADKPREAARQIVSRFASRAFRRPVETDYVDRLMAIYDVAIQHGTDHRQAVEHQLKAVLISPRFLIRLEASQPDQTEPWPVDDYELASRLSYFLWSGPPDETLLKLAADGKLTDSKILEQQTRRMLTDERSEAFIENFFGQWLELRRLATHQADATVFPEYNDAVKTAIAGEVHSLLRELVQQNRPVRELIDSDHTWLNETLAGWYGIPGIKGAEFRRVSLTDRRRGGLLTTAAVLMLQADPGRTNIPRRGNFIAGRILGDAPPPPPPDVPQLAESEGKAKQRTLRERLELHRKNPECASCHARIDPIGFSLENYDAVGRWREQDAGQPIDPGGELPGGRKLAGPADLKDVILEREAAFTRTLVENLLIYALGRSLQVEDECVIRDTLAAAEKHDGKFAEIIVNIVQSYPFRYRRNADF